MQAARARAEGLDAEQIDVARRRTGRLALARRGVGAPHADAQLPPRRRRARARAGSAGAARQALDGVEVAVEDPRDAERRRGRPRARAPARRRRRRGRAASRERARALQRGDRVGRGSARGTRSRAAAPAATASSAASARRRAPVALTGSRLGQRAARAPRARDRGRAPARRAARSASTVSAQPSRVAPGPSAVVGEHDRAVGRRRGDAASIAAAPSPRQSCVSAVQPHELEAARGGQARRSTRRVDAPRQAPQRRARRRARPGAPARGRCRRRRRLARSSGWRRCAPAVQLHLVALGQHPPDQRGCAAARGASGKNVARAPAPRERVEQPRGPGRVGAVVEGQRDPAVRQAITSVGVFIVPAYPG